MVVRPAVSAAILVPVFARHFPSVRREVPFLRILLCATAVGITLVLSNQLTALPFVRIVLGVALAILSYGAMLVATGLIKAPKLKVLAARRSKGLSGAGVSDPEGAGPEEPIGVAEVEPTSSVPVTPVLPPEGKSARRPALAEKSNSF